MDTSAERTPNTVMPPAGQSGTAGVPALMAGVVARRALLRRLDEAERVVEICAPAGTGKTVLMRSWIADSGLEQRAAWVTAERPECDPRSFWIAVTNALRGAAAGRALVRPLTAAPDLDGWAIVERLLKDLVPLDERLWLVIDDVHELGPEALRQLELLIMRASPDLRLVLATRHDLRLGLHRLRLEGELTEIRQHDLRFTVAEAGELFAAAGVELPEAVLRLLHEGTEGWAAGLRLAALSLARHPDPERFAAGFSGTERTVAEYLLAEVLDRQTDDVRRLLLRTSILERVTGELADLLTGERGGEKALQDLERESAFVVSVDAQRSWFRYHQMFADLLRLELRRTAPNQVTALHRTAAGWFAGHGHPVEAIRHAQAAREWQLAVRLLADHWPGLYLDGHAALIRELLAGFPARARAADAELAALAAADELVYGTLEGAERYLGVAEPAVASVPDTRRVQARLLLGIVRLALARQRGNPPVVAEEAQRLQAMAQAPDAAQSRLAGELRALTLISLGGTEVWAGQFQEAASHLEQGVTLAHRIGRPYLELSGLGYQAAVEFFRSCERSAGYARQAIELGGRHGWGSDPAAGTACIILGAVLTWQGKLDDAEPWVQRAERALRAEAEPATVHLVRYISGLLELARGRDAAAAAIFQATGLLDQRLAAPVCIIPWTRTLLVHALVRLGETERAGQVLAELGDRDRAHAETHIATAMLHLAQDAPQAAVAALAPVIDGELVLPRIGLVHAFLLEAIARDALGDPVAAGRALERALDHAEPDGVVLWFVLHPVAGSLLERHGRHRTAHAALIAEILSLLSGQPGTLPPAGPQPPREALSDSEVRVLRYLPTNLTAPEIARELSVSRNTVKTHMRNLYAKLGTHRRTEAVARARGLGLLAPTRPRR